MQVPLEWKLSVTGDNQVKSVMSDLNSAFQRGQISGSDYADSMSKVGREANKVNNISRYQNQIFLSMHPNINRLSRGFSTLSSITRTTLSLITALNTVFTANNTQSSAMAQALADAAEASRGLANSKPGSEEWQKFNEQLSIANATINELKQQEFATTLSMWGIGIIAAVQGGQAFIKALPSIVNGLKLLSAVSLTSVISILPLIIAVAAITAGILLIGAALEKFKGEDGPFSALVDGAVEFLGLKDEFMLIGQFFMETLPLAIQNVGILFTTTWEKVVVATRDLINWIVSGIEQFVNTFINAINEMIKAYNNTAGKLFGKIGLLSQITLPKLKTNGEWISNNVSSPTTTISNSGSQVGPSNTYVTIQGSVLSEREFTALMDSTFKKWMKDRGFTGYQ